VPLPPLHGHEAQRAAVLAAQRAGTLTQSLLLHGPPGIGKERFGLWLAALLLCPAPVEDGPCGTCSACRRVERLEHPDVHWFFPLPRPEGSTPERLRDRLEEARAAELEARRADPLHVPAFDRPPAHYLQSVLTLQRLAALRPSVGDRKVFLVGDAEAMVPQEASPEAANAFLKLLEEPPADTTLILTASVPGALLPTIRSRVLPVRLLPLGESVVAAFLEREAALDAPAAAALARASAGRIGMALRLRGGEDGPLKVEHDAARDLLVAAVAGEEWRRFAAATAADATGARGGFSGRLGALALWLRDLMAVAAGAEGEVRREDADLELLRSLAATPGLSPAGVATAILHVREGQRLASGNVNPQLILATLLGRMRRALREGS
jgi:DNA polymerase III subunit delta'